MSPMSMKRAVLLSRLMAAAFEKRLVTTLHPGAAAPTLVSTSSADAAAIELPDSG